MEKDRAKGLKRVVGKGKRMICPVCREEIHEINLPDWKSVVEDSLAWIGLEIVDSIVRFLIDFDHRYSDTEVTMDEPHTLTAVFDSEFDGKGECIRFEIAEVRTGKQSSMK